MSRRKKNREYTPTEMDLQVLRKHKDKVINGTLLDDAIMGRVFSKKNVLERVLNIALDRNDIRIKTHTVQKTIENLCGRSVRFDVLVTTDNGEQIDLEIQRSEDGLSEERIRYYHSILDAHTLQKGQDFKNLPNQTVMFIYEKDPYGHGLPYYMVCRWFPQLGIRFPDRQMTLYFNTSCNNGDTPIHDLNWDMRCSDPSKMRIPELAAEMTLIKNDEKEILNMCKEFDKTYLSGKNDTATEIAKNMIQKKYSFEEIAELTGVDLETIRALANDQK